MANEQSGIKFFVILTILCLSARPCFTQDDEGEASPLLEVMQTLLKDSSKGQGGGLSLLGPMLQGFLQNGGGKQLGDLLAGGEKKSATLNILSGIGSLLQAQQRGKSNSESAGGGGFDPAILGTVIDLFSSLNEAQSNGPSEKEQKAQAPGRKQREVDNGMDWEPILSVVGNAVSGMMAGGEGGEGKSGSGGASGLESLLTFLPVVMSSLGGRHQPHASGNVQHHDHAPFLPPFLENMHEYWDHFTSSQFGRALWENSGLSALVAQFQDKEGNFVPARVFDSLENNAFRRRWIRAISSFVAEWANHMADKETQKKYLDTVQVVVNGFLQSEGYPKKAMLDLKRPGDSISALADQVFSRQLNLKVNSAQYVKPAINYFQEVFGVTQKSGILVGLTAQTIESKLSNTLEAQLIEPVLRANRAYRFAIKNQSCAKYVLCVVYDTQSAPQDQPGIKPAIVKSAGLATAWFLSAATDLSFFELVGAAADGNCRQFDSGDNCVEFHDEDLKATTEYFHNEL